MTSKLSFLGFAVTAFLISASGCGSGSTIELNQPVAPSSPSAPNQKPGESGTPDQPSNGDDSSNPSNPSTPPVPSSPKKIRYRVMCESKSLETLASISTNARASEIGLTVSLRQLSGPNDVATRENANVLQTRKAMLVPGAPVDVMSTYFVGRRKSDGGSYGSERFYFSDIDLLTRVGVVTDLGSVPSVSGGAASLASSMSLQSVNYGASDLGTYTLLPGGGGFKVLSRDRKKQFGTISIDASRALYPRILENEKLFTAIVYEGGSFRQVIKTLNITSTSVSVANTLSLGSSGRSALPLQRFDAHSFAWAESSAASNTITIAKIDLKTSKVVRANYKTKISGAVIFPQAAFYADDSGEPTVAIAVEKISSWGQLPFGKGKVDYAMIQKLRFSSNSLVEGDEMDYPAVSIDRVTSSGRRDRFLIRSLFSTPNADELLATIDGRVGIGYQLFKDRGGSLDAVGEDDCVHPTLVQDTL